MLFGSKSARFDAFLRSLTEIMRLTESTPRTRCQRGVVGIVGM